MYVITQQVHLSWKPGAGKHISTCEIVPPGPRYCPVCDLVQVMPNLLALLRYFCESISWSLCSSYPSPLDAPFSLCPPEKSHVLHNGKPGPTRRRTHKNKKTSMHQRASTLKIGQLRHLNRHYRPALQLATNRPRTTARRLEQHYPALSASSKVNTGLGEILKVCIGIVCNHDD